jgi:hypothetical protein
MPHRSLLVPLVPAIATLGVLTGTVQSQTPAPSFQALVMICS